MKRFFLFVYFLFTIICAYSQQHLEFRDIPIDGPIKTFVKKLKKQGYKQVFDNGRYRTFEGRFAVGDARITVYSTEKTKTVWKVCVVFGVYDSWNEANNIYSSLKDLYVTKYGTPNNVYEFFAPEYIGREFEAITNEKGACASFFDVPNGYINITIDCIDYRGAVIVTYEDIINGDLFSKEKLDGI